MNTYKKYCPNVFVAQCDNEYKKGEIITLTTRYGKENEHEVVNCLGKTREGKYLYSIIRVDGFNSQERAKKRADQLNSWAVSAGRRSDILREASNEGRDFLELGQPILVGHHSEKRHRALIERNHNRMSNAMQELQKAEDYEQRSKYWEDKSQEINLSMPESIDFYKMQLEEAESYHQGLKNNEIKRLHSFSLTYAKKKVNDLIKKIELAEKLWGEN